MHYSTTFSPSCEDLFLLVTSQPKCDGVDRADGRHGLRVVDVSTPSAPVEAGFYDTPGSADGVAAAGGYAYVADQSGGLLILRFSPPTSWIYVPLVMR
jgi:hypothetical protein